MLQLSQISLGRKMKRYRNIERFIIREIVHNVEQLDVDDNYKSNIYAFLSSTMNYKSPIPSLCLVEDKNVVIHWVCGLVSIEVEFNNTGAFYMWGKNAQGKEYSSENYDTIVANTSHLLREMEDRLDQHNPDWREKYLESIEEMRTIVQ